MVMPVMQRCPSCFGMFLGSDSIGGKCPTCEIGSMKEFFDNQSVQWTCPEHPEALTNWQHVASDPGGTYSIATCNECGKESGIIK